MGIALLAASAFAQPLHALGLWWRRQRNHGVNPACRAPTCSVARHAAPTNQAMRSAIAATPHASPMAPMAAKPGQVQPVRATESAPTTPPGPMARATRPYRPVRVLRRPNQGGGSERLVISGRMVDVCAELERLVAREAQL